jgi:predicted site-specific integrase-resolvase
MVGCKLLSLLLSSISAVKLSHWARKHGISYLTAWRWFKAGKLPVPARQLPSGTILVEEPSPGGRTVLYARVSSADQRADLERQVERLKAFAQVQGWQDFEVVAEIGSGLNGKRRKLLRVLKDPTVGRIVVEHRDRLARFGFEMVEAALHASGKRIVVVAAHLGEGGPKAEGEVKDDLVRDLLKVLTSTCERPMKRSARDRVKRILESICG